MKYTDYSQVLELARNILKDDKKMIELTYDLGKELQTLKGSFQDDAIEDIDRYVGNLLNKLQVSQESFKTIATELVAYAEILKAGKA